MSDRGSGGLKPRPPVDKGLGPAIRVGVVDGEPAVTLTAGELEATFLPGLGLLGTALRHRGEDLLALPGGVAGYRDRHVTGLPILAPWANRLPSWRYRAAGVEVDLEGLDLATDPGGLPIHGTLTARRGWRLERLAAEADRALLEASFDHDARPELLAAFPFPHTLTVAAVVEEASLAVTTTLAATGDRPVPVGFGWHPYLRLPGAPRAAWRLLLPDRTHLELDGRGLPTGKASAEPAEADPVGDRTYDDLYTLEQDPAARRLGLEAAGRRLLVDYGDGYDHAQVFAPPGAEFVCLEPMTVPTAALAAGTTPLVQPGGTFTARFTILVEDA
ncbi:MAG TPA: aldose 1-epimerase [Actinomycetota bacterium]|nr:aldose 1-epimerase [Actinomycetota bacterium]